MVLQLEAAECGAASLAIILGFHGRFAALDELRTLCGVSRDGAKASSVLRAARTFGLEAKGRRAEMEELQGLSYPLIAFVNFNHFLVVEGVDQRHVWINDPAAGRRRETLAEFSESFSGVALVFSRTAAFQPGDTRPSLLGSLARRFDGLGAALRYAVLVSLALVFPGILLPVFSRLFVDDVLVAGIRDWLPALLIGMSVTAIARMTLLELQAQALMRTRTAMTLVSGGALMRKLLSLPIAFFEQRFAGEVADRVRLNEELSGLLTGRLAEAAVGLVSALFFLFTMLLYHAPLALGVLALALLNGVVLAWSQRFLSEQYRKASIDYGKLMGARIAGLKDMETFKASGAEEVMLTRWLGLTASMLNTQHVANRWTAWILPVPEMLGSLITALVLIGGGFAVVAGDLSLGSLVAFQTLAASFVAPIGALAGFGSELQQVRSYTSRLDDVLDQAADVRFDHPFAAPSGAMPGASIVMSGIGFGYAPLDPPLIQSFDLSLRPGMRIALVGASGSGKSTLGKIIAGLNHPCQGTRLVGGRALLEWPREILAQRLAYVSQQVRLFEGSIRENLSLWDPSLPEAAIIRAAQDARIHEVIASRPGSYDAQVSEGGRNFSGGERQRLEIARALATDPAILVLDEATSALDAVTELEVLEAIRRRGLSCVLIAHRLSAIRDCDEILLLDRGRIAERGTHQALAANGGPYVRLLEA